MEPSVKKPIFIFWTRSFWLTVFAIGTMLLQDSMAIYSFADFLGDIFSRDFSLIADKAVRYAPAILFVLAIRERAGAARPYTMDPSATS